MTPPEPRLDRERHVKYWQRCRNSYLPSAYTAADSTRLMWAGFIFSAYDVLSIPINDKDRTDIRSWVLSLQHPDGGFCGSPTHAHDGQDAYKGTANVAATFFALVLLALAAEDGEGKAKGAFAGVNRGRLLRWLKKLQRGDGSFGQNLWDGQPVGGRDTRHSYLASSIRWMLRGNVEEGDEAWVGDIDIDAMARHVRQGQTYDGGLVEDNEHESHAGYAYCSIAALSLADRPLSYTSPRAGKALNQGVTDRSGLLKFLAGRQFTYRAEEEDDESDEDEENFVETEMGSLSLEEGCRHVGFNGRWNKKADTCYCWWVAGTLVMLDAPFTVSIAPSRRYLLEVTQHRIGGFGKVGGAPPDIYHAYLGLAALATMGDEDLKEFDVGLCCSKDTTRKIEEARDGLVQSIQKSAKQSWVDDGFWSTS